MRHLCPVHVGAARDNHMLSYRSCRLIIVACAVWHVASPCWNHMSLVSISSSLCYKNLGHRSVCRCRLWQCQFWKKHEPVIPPNQNPHQRVAFSGFIWWWYNSSGTVQIRQFCLFIYPFILKWASSIKMSLQKMKTLLWKLSLLMDRFRPNTTIQIYGRNLSMKFYSN